MISITLAMANLGFRKLNQQKYKTTRVEPTKVEPGKKKIQAGLHWSLAKFHAWSLNEEILVSENAHVWVWSSPKSLYRVVWVSRLSYRNPYSECIYIYIYMGVSNNRGKSPPKWMVKMMVPNPIF